MMRCKSVMVVALGILLGAMMLQAQVLAPPAPWRGAGPVPCVGVDGGIFKCAPAPRAIAVRAGHLFDSKSGQMLRNQVVVLMGDKITEVGPEGQVKIPTGAAAGKVLTEMLRSRYGIATENCVTHAQVSVNPQNMRIGEHTDWAGKFPFAGVGLPDNYSIPLASLYVFGFDYDSVFVRATGARWRGLDLAELKVARQAAAEGLETRRYRAILQHRYKDIASALKEKSAEVDQ